MTARTRQKIEGLKEMTVEDCMSRLRYAVPKDESEMTPEEIEKIKNTRVGFVHDNEDPRRGNHLFDSLPYYTDEVMRRMRQDVPYELHPDPPYLTNYYEGEDGLYRRRTYQ